ncbi:DDE-type integrase/transposase/recombinase [Raoultella sp. 10-1]|nr:DDE-type integrase/transposase/recombinase [Raoultella sp. 10-1]
MDFVSDALFDGRRLRLLTVIDLYTRECLGICVGQNLRSTEVAEMLNSIALRRPLPQLLKTDNGSEFAGKMLDRWVYERGIRIDFSRPGTPTDNATVGSFKQVKAGMSERELVHVSGGCTVQNRGLAHTL